MRDGPENSVGETDDVAATSQSQNPASLTDKEAEDAAPAHVESTPSPVPPAEGVQEVSAELHPLPSNPPSNDDDQGPEESLKAVHPSWPTDAAKPTLSSSSESNPHDDEEDDDGDDDDNLIPKLS